MEEEYAMYVLVNSDLHMSAGKIASQVAHVAEKIAEKTTIALYEDETTAFVQKAYMIYTKNGRKKVILNGTQKDLESFMNDTDATYEIDPGRTEIPENSLTAVAFFPSNQNKERFHKFRLL